MLGLHCVSLLIILLQTHGLSYISQNGTSLYYAIYPIGGECGRKAGYIKPFESLTAKGLQNELNKRGWETSGTTKKELTQTLKNNLKGVQRVPSLLLTNPTESLADLNLEHYHVLECEPLHDLKGQHPRRTP